MFPFSPFPLPIHVPLVVIVIVIDQLVRVPFLPSVSLFPHALLTIDIPYYHPSFQHQLNEMCHTTSLLSHLLNVIHLIVCNRYVTECESRLRIALCL
jgi:hypothetical protein